jgi:hypothetical protein
MMQDAEHRRPRKQCRGQCRLAAFEEEKRAARQCIMNKKHTRSSKASTEGLIEYVAFSFQADFSGYCDSQR